MGDVAAPALTGGPLAMGGLRFGVLTPGRSELAAAARAEGFWHWGLGHEADHTA